jgi:hypothetical protein
MSLRQFKAPCTKEVRADPGYRRIDRHGGALDGDACRDGRGDAVDIGLVRQRFCVGGNQRPYLTGLEIAEPLPGPHLDRIGAERADTVQDLLLRARA